MGAPGRSDTNCDEQGPDRASQVLFIRDDRTSGGVVDHDGEYGSLLSGMCGQASWRKVKGAFGRTGMRT